MQKIHFFGIKYLKHFLIISFCSTLTFSCKKKAAPTIKNPICINVKDSATHLNVQGADVTITVQDYNSLTVDFHSVSDSYGNTCFDIYDSKYILEIKVDKYDFEKYCKQFRPATEIPRSVDVLILNRNSFIKAQLINTNPLFIPDSMQMLSWPNNDYYCMGPHRVNSPYTDDTTLIIIASAGINNINLILYKFNSPLLTEARHVTVPVADTADLVIYY